MLSGSPDRFVVKPSRLEDLTPLYDAMPNFKSALDEIKRQIALAASSSDDLDVMPMLIWGDPGIGKTKFAKEVAKMISTGFSMCPMSSLTAGWIFSGASSQWKSAKPGAEILRGKRFIDFFERNLSPMAFIQQLRFERAPSGVEDALSHRGFEQLGGRHPTTMTPSF
jgi:hypothetical protein